MKIVFLDAKTVGDLSEIEDFKKFGDLKVFQTTKQVDVMKRIKGAEVVITNKVVIDKKTIKNSPDLKLICVAATGTNNIDLDAAMKAGIKVRNVKGYSTESVAQHTFALLFYILNHLSFYSSFVNSKKYSRSEIFTSLDREIREINGKVFGIIGLGAIGQRVADLAMAFGAQVIYYSTSGKHTDIRYKRVSLEELLAVSDVISIHAPLNENTKGLIGLTELKKAKRTAVILNTGRGGIIKEKDLVTALNKNIIHAAGIDVYEKEPISPTHPFYNIKQKERLVLTPHVAWSSVEARRELVAGVSKNIQEFIEEKN